MIVKTWAVRVICCCLVMDQIYLKLGLFLRTESKPIFFLFQLKIHKGSVDHVINFLFI